MGRLGARVLPTIGIDIGGTSVRAGVIDAAGVVLASARAATPHQGQRTDDLLISMIGELAAAQPVSAVGLAVAGFISADRERVMFAPHLPWRDSAVPARIAARIGLPVVMEHDVNAAVWAESTRGAAAGSGVALLIALGTGIGAGLLVDGTVFRGAHGVAPELGHLVVVPEGRSCPCGKRGCWERYCSGTALADTAREMRVMHDSALLDELARWDPAAITGTLVARAAAGGDRAALAAMADLAGWLGTGLALAADVFDPDMIVIGGGVSAAADLYLARAVDKMESLMTGGGYRPKPRVVPARFGDRASMIGAALLAARAARSELTAPLH